MVDFNSLTVKDLKERLKDQGLPTVGRKSELVDRLIAASHSAVDAADEKGSSDPGAGSEHEAASTAADAQHLESKEKEYAGKDVSERAGCDQAKASRADGPTTDAAAAPASTAPSATRDDGAEMAVVEGDVKRQQSGNSDAQHQQMETGGHIATTKSTDDPPAAAGAPDAPEAGSGLEVAPDTNKDDQEHAAVAHQSTAHVNARQVVPQHQGDATGEANKAEPMDATPSAPKGHPEQLVTEQSLPKVQPAAAMQLHDTASEDSLSYGDEDEEPAPPTAAAVVEHEHVPQAEATSRAQGQDNVREQKQEEGGRMEEPPAKRRRGRSPRPNSAYDAPRTHPLRGAAQADLRRQVGADAAATARRRSSARSEEGLGDGSAGAAERAKRKRQQIVFDPGSSAAPAPTAPAAASAGRARKADKVELEVQEVQGPTRALHIEGLRRPLRESDLKALLSETGTLQAFWIDSLKSHCYAVFATVEEAQATLRATDHKDWPPRCKSCMLPSFVALEEAQGMIAARGHAVLRRVPSDAGGVAPRRTSRGNDNSSETLRTGVRQGATVEHSGSGMRGRGGGREALVDLTAGDASDLPAADAVEAPAQIPAPAPLGELFLKTKVAPQIFWLPLPEEVAEARRLEEGDRKGGKVGEEEGERVGEEAVEDEEVVELNGVSTRADKGTTREEDLLTEPLGEA